MPKSYSAPPAMTIDESKSYSAIFKTNHGDINIDLFALHQEETKAAVQLFHLRKGRIVDRQEYFWDDLRIGTTSSDIFSSLLKQYYLNSRFIPDQVLVTSSFEDQETLEHFLSTQKKHKVKVKVPLRGHKKKLINLVQKNSKLSFCLLYTSPSPRDRG